MRISEQPTDHILIKAYTDSEWDCCDFALVTLSEEWKRRQATRCKTVEPYKEDSGFYSLNFFDGASDFYRSGTENEDVESLLKGRGWTFVELEEGETERLIPPKNSLRCYRIVIYRDGSARYEAHGKHTSEEFWTYDLPLKELIEQSETDSRHHE